MDVRERRGSRVDPNRKSTNQFLWETSLLYLSFLFFRAISPSLVNCPFCCGARFSKTNSLASRNPKLLQYWDYEKNSPLTPETISYQSNRKVHWQCPKSKDHQFMKAPFQMMFIKEGCMSLVQASPLHRLSLLRQSNHIRYVSTNNSVSGNSQRMGLLKEQRGYS